MKNVFFTGKVEQEEKMSARLKKTHKCMKTDLVWEIHEIVSRALQTIFLLLICGKKQLERMWMMWKK